MRGSYSVKPFFARGFGLSAEDEPVGLRELKHPTAREKKISGNQGTSRKALGARLRRKRPVKGVQRRETSSFIGGQSENVVKEKSCQWKLSPFSSYTLQ